MLSAKQLACQAVRSTTQGRRRAHDRAVEVPGGAQRRRERPQAHERTVEAAGALVEQGVDYLGVGAIFEARVSKPNASAPRGVEVLQALRGAHPALPFVAIGGVEAETAGACLAAGADGVAVIRAAWGAGAPALARALSR